MHQYGVFRRLLGCGAGEDEKMTRWGEIKCPRCAELEAELRESALQELAALGQASEAYQAQKDAEAKLAEADGALNICSASWGECNRILDETKAKLAQQDDDFYPASAGDDPIWLGGVEYITKSRSDDLVQAAVAAERERCANVAESVALPMDGRNAKAQADYMSKVIAAAIREGEE
jgi:hypothetical protein